MNWMLLPYRRYGQFSGRSRRKEYWMFVLFYVLVSSAISIVFGVNETTRAGFYWGVSSQVTGVGGIIANLFGLVSLIPSLAVLVRRLHDTDRSGWWAVLILLPILGWFVLLIYVCLDGNQGPNRYGDDPKNASNADVFA